MWDTYKEFKCEAHSHNEKIIIIMWNRIWIRKARVKVNIV
jgi:hypothetical protein